MMFTVTIGVDGNPGEIEIREVPIENLGGVIDSIRREMGGVLSITARPE